MKVNIKNYPPRWNTLQDGYQQRATHISKS